jgi:dTDP-4-dehydrorhamnose 3,5-epimerase
MEIRPSAIADVIIITPKLFSDERGFFLETYQLKTYQQVGIAAPFVQDNHSGSKRNVLRGLHYQIRHPQGKLVRVVAGEIFDVAVDVRRSSPTFGKWVGEELTAKNAKQLWIPPGCAHGFFVLSEWAELVYKVTDYYAPEWDRTLRWDDPTVGIQWPVDKESSPILSEKDRAGKLLSEAELFE